MDWKNVLILSLASVSIALVIILSMSKSIDDVNVSNSTCYYSERLGNRKNLYLHVCRKGSSRVYDVRYFFKDDSPGLKANVVGVQLDESEFKNLCKTCLN